jgi:hypothetical protein
MGLPRTLSISTIPRKKRFRIKSYFA